MGVYTVNDPPTASSVVITPNNAAASDTFPAQAGETYIIDVNNAGGSPDSVAVDDPTSVAPSGATAFNPDLTISVTNGTRRQIRVDGTRHRDSTGNITVTHSFTASVTVVVTRAGRV